ncbi:hypothetical protein ACSCBZ_46735 [Streptomyces niveiscabiei]|uniref:hypothetical protein n=1 Tax=Streptomyces niveiscabiei TaxID=164115 RepID=UPI003EBD00B6
MGRWPRRASSAAVPGGDGDAEACGEVGLGPCGADVRDLSDVGVQGLAAGVDVLDEGGGPAAGVRVGGRDQAEV